MNLRSFLITLLILLLLLSCKSAQVYDVDNVSLSTAGKSHAQIKAAILNACQRARWKPVSIQPGVIIARYSAKRGKFTASARIAYNNRSYSIKYLNSKNLKYTDQPAATKNKAEQFFTENNPFNQDQTAPENSETRQVIHKAYNKWVKILEREINKALAVSTTRQVSRSSQTPVTSVNKSRYCNDSPNTGLAGQVEVTGSSVNIRSGARTRCPVITVAGKGEVYRLLGRKNSWFQIALNSGQSAWVYSSLVKQTSSGKTAKKMNDSPVKKGLLPVAASIKPPPPPSLPVAPTKKISIAVIRFKTLNKKAQEVALGDLISETFTSKLVNSRSFKIIEREQLDKVVKEMEMNQTGFIEASDAIAVGKMLHADAIITGSVALLNNQIQINARIIEIESAYVIGADTQSDTYTLKKMDKIVGQMVNKLSRNLH